MKKRALALLLCAALPGPGWATGRAAPARPAAGPDPVFLRAFADRLHDVSAGLRLDAPPLALEPVVPGLWSVPAAPADPAAAASALARATLAGPAVDAPEALAARLTAQALADPVSRARTAAALRGAEDAFAGWLAERLEAVAAQAQTYAPLAALGRDLARVPGLGAADILARVFDGRAAAPAAPATEDPAEFAAWAERRFAAGRSAALLAPAPAARPEGVPTDDDLLRDLALSPLTNPEREKVVVELFLKAGAKPEEIVLQPVGNGRHNIYVVKKGRGKRTVVVGGHHDKVKEGHGTIDNWTGATMVVNLYKALREEEPAPDADPEDDPTIVFAAFAREEEGLIGSARFVERLSREERLQIDAMVNLDTLGVDGTFSWKNNSDGALLELIDRVARETGLDHAPMVLRGGDSDSSSFRRYRIPAMTVLGASEKVIWDILHSARDTIAALSLPHYSNAYHLTLALIRKLKKEPVRPRLNVAGIPGDSADDSASLLHLLREVREGRAGPLPAAAFESEYILAPGLNWDLLAALYYRPARERMRALGLASRRVDTDALGGFTGVNAARLAEAVRAAAGPVVLIGHSGGGLDVRKLLSRYPELKPRIKAVVTIQTPHFGTPIADFFVRHPWLYRLVQLFGRVINPWTIGATNWRGWIDSLKEFSRAKLAGDREPFAALDGIPLFSIATRHTSRHPFQRAKAWLAGLSGEDHDGIVATADMVMPGSRYARLDGVGHVATVVPTALRLALTGMNGPYPGFAADLAEAVVRWVHGRRR